MLLVVVPLACLVAAVTIRWMGRPSSRWGLAAVLLASAPVLFLHAGWWWIQTESWGSDYQGTPAGYRRDLADPVSVGADAVLAVLLVVPLVTAVVRALRRRDAASAAAVGAGLVGLAQVASLRLLLPPSADAGFDREQGGFFGSPTRAIDIAQAAVWRSFILALLATCGCAVAAGWAARADGPERALTSRRPRTRGRGPRRSDAGRR